MGRGDPNLAVLNQNLDLVCHPKWSSIARVNTTALLLPIF